MAQESRTRNTVNREPFPTGLSSIRQSRIRGNLSQVEGEGTGGTVPTFSFLHFSEPSSAAPSPDRLSPSAKNGMAADVTPTKDESPNQASKKATESSDEEQQRDLNAKIRLEKEVVKESSEEEEEGSARKRKVWKEESSEEEEKESKGRTRKKPGTKTKQAPGKASGSRKQAREESEDSEEEPAQGPGKKGAKSHQESAKERVIYKQ